MLLFRLYCSLLLIFSVDVYRINKTPGYPVVLIPGDGGSRIEAKLTGKPQVVHYICSKKTIDFFDLWLNLELFAPLVIDCWVDNMKLVYNASDGSTNNKPGVETRIPGFGSTEGLEWLDPSKSSTGIYFSTLVEAMVTWGYRRGKDIVGAPFDWRRAPNEMNDYYRNVQSLIETTYRRNGNRKVVILAHSMGNPVMLYFYNSIVTKDWKDKFIRSHISLAGAWGGAMQIVRLYAAGYNMNHYRIILPPGKLRDMQRSFISSAFLFPSYNLWQFDEVLVSTPKLNYSLNNLKQFFSDVGYASGWDQYQKVGRLLGQLTDPGMEVHCVFGSQVDTPESFIWYSQAYFPDYQPTTTYGDGDGTVNRRSLEACRRWSNVHVHEVPKAEHMAIMQHSAVVELVRSVLYQN